MVGCVPEAVARVQTFNHASNMMLIDDLVEMMPPAALHEPFKHWVFIGFIHDAKGLLTAG